MGKQLKSIEKIYGKDFGGAIDETLLEYLEEKGYESLAQILKGNLR